MKSETPDTLFINGTEHLFMGIRLYFYPVSGGMMFNLLSNILFFVLTPRLLNDVHDILNIYNIYN